MTLVPVPGQHRTPRLPQRQQRRPASSRQTLSHRSGSVSPSDIRNPKPRLGYSRTSSGRHTSRWSHEAALAADRPAVAAAVVAGHHKFNSATDSAATTCTFFIPLRSSLPLLLLRHFRSVLPPSLALSTRVGIAIGIPRTGCMEST